MPIRLFMCAYEVEMYYVVCRVTHTHTHTHNRFTAFLEYVRDHPGEQVPER